MNFKGILAVACLSVAATSMAATDEFTIRMYDQSPLEFRPNKSCDLGWDVKFFLSPSGAYTATGKMTLRGTCELASPQASFYAVFFSHPLADSCGTASANFGTIFSVGGKMETHSNGEPKVVEGSFEDNRRLKCNRDAAATIILNLDENLTLYSHDR